VKNGATSAQAAPATKPPAPQASEVIDSQIDGEFTGWSGETVFRLMNGQIWQQTSYAYTYHYSFMPKVLIFEAGVGLTTQHLRRRIRTDIGVEPAPEIERMRQIGRLKLRMRQHASAIGSEASVQMLVWLGKQRLGQTDRTQKTGSGGPFLVVSKEKMTPAEWEAA